MKRLGSLIIILILFFLTGCGSETSDDKQAKTVEYENCLSWEREAWFAQFPSGSLSRQNLEYWRSQAFQNGSRLIPDYFVENCEKYRP